MGFSDSFADAMYLSFVQDLRIHQSSGMRLSLSFIERSRALIQHTSCVCQDPKIISVHGEKDITHSKGYWQALLLGTYIYVKVRRAKKWSRRLRTSLWCGQICQNRTCPVRLIQYLVNISNTCTKCLRMHVWLAGDWWSFIIFSCT